MVQRFLTSSPSLLRPLALLLACLFCFAATGNAADLKLLFMGDNGHHRPEARFQELAPALDARGVQMKYTDRMEDLTADTLGKFDGLVLYANIDRIEDAQAKVVLDYVASGKGFIPLHCATYCWRNNKDIVALMGGQFQRHGGQVFTTQIAAGQHPIMKGYGSFTSWDETYIHHLHNEKNRTVLEYRVEGDQAAGNKREPWTWVRTHGKGRVFYTAWGHDERTFSQPGFHNLVERGIRWACGDDPSVVPAFADPDTFAAPPMTTLRQDVAPFEFIEVGPKIPNYTPGKKWGVQGKPKTTMQLPLSPEESMKHFVTPEGLAVRLYADERDFGDSKTTLAAAPSGQSDAIVSAAKRRQDVASGVSPMLASVPSGQRDVIVSAAKRRQAVGSSVSPMLASVPSGQRDVIASAAKRRQAVGSSVSPMLASVPSGQNDVVVSTAKRRQAVGSSVSPMLASIPSGQSDLIVSAAKRRQDVASGVSPRSDAHKTTEALKGRHTDSASRLGKPIAMNWDERGRLWVCETVDYPNELGGNRDRIRICEDTDHDGRADKFTVFAEGLSIPTAIVIVRGGAVVQNGTETIYLKDTDGDDVSDQKTTLITGWALGDTHGGVSNFRYGLDNWIWSMQGYNNSTPQYDGKTAQSFRMGFWRFKLSQSDPPKVTDLEFVRSSNNNTWGLGISEDGLIFGSTANHNPSMFVPIANRYYESVKGWSPSTLGSIADTYMFDPITENVRQVDQFGGYTAGAGHALYTARTFPQQWWNKTAFVCGPTGHLVGTFVLRRDGANYTSTSPVNLLASDDEWSAPIMAEVGPDGAVWVLDWYNYIVQHNPTPQGFERGKGNAYESDLRDKRHGRIYRIVPTSDDGDTVHEFSSLADVTNKQLVDALKHPSFMWRLHAQRLLVERGAKDVVPALLKLLSDDSVDAVGLNVGAIHALHTLKGLGVIDGDKSVAASPAAVRPFPAAKRRQLIAGGVSHRLAARRQPAVPSGLNDAVVLAAKRRQDVAPGVSPGNVSPNTHQAPKGRQAFLTFNVAESKDLLSRENTPAAPSGLNQNLVPSTPGSRPGLQPVVPSGLAPDLGTLTPGLRPRRQHAVLSGLNDAVVLAAKRRQDVAPGVSPGNVSPNTHQAPKGRQVFSAFNVAESTDLLSRETTPAAPSGLDQNFVPLTPGSRPGLQPSAASGLAPDFGTLTSGLRPRRQHAVLSGLNDAVVLAAKRRQDVTPGVSPGNVSPNTHQAPKGRQAFLTVNVAESTGLSSHETTPAAPSGLNQKFVPLTPGLRPGLQPVVPSGLAPDFGTLTPGLRPRLQPSAPSGLVPDLETLTPGLRPRLQPSAPSGLVPDLETLTPGLRPGLQPVVPSGLKRRMNRRVNLGGPGMMLVSMPNSAIADDAIIIALRNSLAHPSAAVRRNAIAVLPLDEQGLALLLSHQNLFTDNDAQVQLQAFLTLSDMPAGKDSASPIFRVGPNATDSSLIDAITAAAAVHATKNLSRLTQIVEQSDGVVMTMTSDASKKIARRVAEHVARSRPDAAMLTAVVNDLRKADAALRNSILDGLTAGLPANFQFVTTDAFDAALVQALKEADSASKSKLVRLGAQCGTRALDAFAEEIVKTLMAVVGDNGASDRNRIAAAKDLVGFRPNDAAIVSQVVGQLNAQTPPQLGAALLLAIQDSKSAAAGEGIVEAMPTLTPQLKSAAIGTLLSRPDWAKSLLAGIERRDIELSDLSLDQKQSLRAFPDKAIKAQAEKLLAMGGGLPDANRDKVLQALMHLCEEEGNVDDGREMFKKHCMKCHKHGQLGDKNIGPNLTGMAVHPKEELLTHIIDPSRSVEGNFRIYTVVDIDGRVKNGMLASETRTSITLIDTEAKETSIQREDIDELVASKKSVMPEGFEKQMTEVELSNLLEFLTNKGKYVPVPLDRYATAISTKGLFSDNDNGPDRLVFSDWSPKMFGEIPFLLTDPMGKSKPNIILLYGPNSPLPASMPKSVTLPCNTAAKTIHLLGGVGGWNHPYNSDKTVSLIVRLHYSDGTHEDHELLNAVHIADYIRKVDVPGSDFAFMLGGQQVRHVAVTPKKTDKIATIELVKGPDRSAPIVMGVTIER